MNSTLVGLPQLEKKWTWTVTGAAGFIGSHLVEALLLQNQNVIGVDNFLTGSQENLNLIQNNVGSSRWANFAFIKGSITERYVCQQAVSNSDFVLHQAALGSVPRSIKNPLPTHENNVNGFLEILTAAKEAKVKRFIYASSSSVYGDHPTLPKVEEQIGTPQSPYAITKLTNELYATNFSKLYNMETLGLRYFNVFGPRQDPNGPYAAVIPKWIQTMIAGEQVQIFGDGQTSRDFSFVSNIVSMNLLAATTKNKSALNKVYNCAAGERTTLNDLYKYLRGLIPKKDPSSLTEDPMYLPFRTGDIQHSLADISKAKTSLNYHPICGVKEGLKICVDWYLNHSPTLERLSYDHIS